MPYDKMEMFLNKLPESYEFWLTYMDVKQYAVLHEMIGKHIKAFAKDLGDISMGSGELEKQAVSEFLADMLSYMFIESAQPEKEMKEYLEYLKNYAMRLLTTQKQLNADFKLN